MNPVVQLKFVAVDDAVQIETGVKKNLITKVVSYEEDSHCPRALLVVLLELFLVLLHLSMITGDSALLTRNAFS
jgi:hypothetical protein